MDSKESGGGCCSCSRVRDIRVLAESPPATLLLPLRRSSRNQGLALIFLIFGGVRGWVGVSFAPKHSSSSAAHIYAHTIRPGGNTPNSKCLVHCYQGPRFPNPHSRAHTHPHTYTHTDRSSQPSPQPSPHRRVLRSPPPPPRALAVESHHRRVASLFEG